MGGWVTRARRAASNTNASFRTESQSFLTRAVPRVRAGARLENRPSQDAAVRQTLGERIAAVRRFDYGPNAFVQRRETSVQSSLRRARLEIQSAFEGRRRFTPALIVLPAAATLSFSISPVEEAAMDRLKLETA
jgi:hypothetical protein